MRYSLLRIFIVYLLIGLVGLGAFYSDAYAESATSSFDEDVSKRALPLNRFGQLPILHEGRIKPLESFARAQKKYLLGTDDDALRWLQVILFDPAKAEEHAPIRISNPDVLNMLNLERRDDKLYSYQAINAALMQHQDILQALGSAAQEDWTQAQHDLVDLKQKTDALRDFLASLSAFLPLAAQIPAADQADISVLPRSMQAHAGDVLSYYRAAHFKSDLQAYLKDLTATQGRAIEGYSDLQQALVYLGFSMDSLWLNAPVSSLFRVIHVNKDLHLTPWQILQQNQDVQGDVMERWQALVSAYHAHDLTQWNAQLDALSGQADMTRALRLEYHMTRLNPLQNTIILYGVALAALALAAFMRALDLPRGGAFVIALNLSAFAALLCGLLLHLFYLAARIYILQRPPVSTLFESVLFVSALSVLCAVIFHLRSKRLLWLWGAAFLGVFLQILALSHDQDGDNMMMLGAVLNTNFWLATHVICITAGYGFCILTSALAHYQLGAHAWRRRVIKQDDVQKMLHFLALLSLLFSAVGTVLGGIWADQSWGRFWGWDPKENGALLIVLWLVWILHGRISGQMREVLFTAGLAYLSVITALSWFGVNLLGVGLHSYGFTQGMMASLFGFIALESLLIAGFVWRVPVKAKFKSKKVDV